MITPEAQTALIQVGVGALVVIVLFVVLVPRLLDWLERMDFRALVAVRLLRARKSGFVTVIGALSFLAVMLASAALVVVLSVMGGFRHDLRQKILGQYAHVTIDRKDQPIENWNALLAQVRQSPDVRAASPFISGEVMLTSSTNREGVVLRGVDPDTIGHVTRLPQNLRAGRLEYLKHPEKLLTLPPEEVDAAWNESISILTDEDRGKPAAKLPPPKPVTARARPDGGVNVGMTALLDSLFASTRGRDAGAPRAVGRTEPSPFDPFPTVTQKPFQRARPTYPGIIIGRELAHALRVSLGDDISVISPLGELGPTGPVPKSRPFRVAGVFYTGFFEFDMKLAIIDLHAAQEFLKLGDKISGIDLRVSRLEDADDVARDVGARLRRSDPALADLRVRPWQQLNARLFGALELEKLAMFLFLGIGIVVAGFCPFATITLFVQEKLQLVGVLQALGAEPKSIVAIFLLDGFFLGILGSGFGLALGATLCFLGDRVGIPMNGSVYYIKKVPIHLDGNELAVVGVAGVVVCVCAAIFPALLASRTRPVDALRGV